MHDVVMRGGTIYDGEGGSPYAADVAIDGDSIAAVMPAIGDRGRREIDVSGLAVAPGFINMLSWAIPSLIADGRAQSDVRQGVTLEVFGEGSSMGPLTDAMRRDQIERQGDIKYDIPWTTLRQGLDHVVRLGVSVNVASFVGATTLRIHEVGYDDRPPTREELERMRRLARDAAADGALGLGSALIYTPGTFASTDELTALAEAAGGMYISHLRNEGERLLEAIEELIEITRRARVRGEIYHLKQAGRSNWSKLPAVIDRIESARDARARIGLGEPLPRRRRRGGRSPRVVQERSAEAAHRKDAGRRGEDARQNSGGDGDGPRRRGREPRRRLLLHRVRGQPAPRGGDRMDELWLR